MGDRQVRDCCPRGQRGGWSRQEEKGQGKAGFRESSRGTLVLRADALRAGRREKRLTGLPGFWPEQGT